MEAGLHLGNRVSVPACCSPATFASDIQSHSHAGLADGPSRPSRLAAPGRPRGKSCLVSISRRAMEATGHSSRVAGVLPVWLRRPSGGELVCLVGCLLVLLFCLFAVSRFVL